MIIVFCSCGERYVVEDRLIGSHILCRECGNLQPIIPVSYLARHSGNSAKPSAERSYKAEAVFNNSKRGWPATTASMVFLALILLAGVTISGTLVYKSKSKATRNSGQPLPVSTLPTESKGNEAVQEKAQPSSAKQPKGNRSQEGEKKDVQRRDDLDKLAELIGAAPEATAPPTQIKKGIPLTEIEPLKLNRLHTGAAPLGDGVREGRCIVKVINGTDTDALVRVMRADGGERLFRNFYILEGATFTAEKLPTGNYVLKVALGSDWNEKQKRFNYRRSFEKTELFTLTETASREQTAEGYVDRIRFSNVTITLHKVIDGNFHLIPISEAEFWR